MSLDLDPALQTFFAECAELLEGMEAALLRLEHAASDPELINDVFRAAHTIKGSAGIFGFDEIVGFTHQVESLLDGMRAGTHAVTEEAVALLLACGDHLRAIIALVAAGQTREPALTAREKELVIRLERMLRDGVGPAAAGAGAGLESASAVIDGGEGSATRTDDLDAPHVAADHWHLSLRFGPDVLRNGMDPLAFLRYLGTLGEIRHVETLIDAMPEAAAMDPESCYLGFEIAFASTAGKAEIENVFEFVRDDCRLAILAPRSRLCEYVALIEALPEETLRLGEILVRCGALTVAELERGLSRQAPPGAAGLPKAPPLGEILVEQGAVDVAVVAAALDKQTQVKEHKADEARFIRVDADRLDQLINLVGELVIAGAGTQLLAAQAGDPALGESTANVLRLVEEVRNTALGLRMVPIGATFHRFRRVVRDVSRQLGKDIELAISGADTELDKSVVEKIGDPLMHLVRNAMDHGIEPAETRRAHGKSPRARVSLDAYHDSGSIVIEVADDGAGLDRQRILAKARARGLVAADQVPTDREIDQFIFAAGFSTAEQVSDLSGRGVGMDVVRRNIEALRGAIELDSAPGRGTTVRIRLPLTLAIIDGFLIGIGAARYVIPVDMVVECVELAAHHAAAARERGYTELRGEVLPCLWLRDLFELGGEKGRRENIVVVQLGGRKAGLVVDQLLGEAQTVIKPLGHLFERLRGISGSTILGSGEVALILDVLGLVQGLAPAGRRPGAGQTAVTPSTRALPATAGAAACE